ncbi:hypothetical protein ACI2LF_29220 [Kribbella sp. NPDC020789]
MVRAAEFGPVDCQLRAVQTILVPRDEADRWLYAELAKLFALLPGGTITSDQADAITRSSCRARL